jgi:sulfotransferase family protein
MTGIGTADELTASAAKFTGLSDFGEDFGDGWADGLEALLASYASDESLTEKGVKAARAMVRGALMARLASQAAWAAHPSHASVPIEQPIFVTGLPRTGTTALHRLLAADPRHQGLELWLSEMPQPRPPRGTWSSDTVYQMIEAGVKRHQVSRPEFLGVHELGADQVEECWQLLRQSLRSVSFECLAHLPSYSSWLARENWTASYRRHRRNLQLIGLPDADKRWVLKNPSHLFALDALLSVYPDALVIVTHRSPRTAVASACSLAAQASSGWSQKFQGPVIGTGQLSLWARGMEAFSAARARHDSSRFYDVAYPDFVADPLGTAAAVYSHFGLSLTPEATDAMRAVTSESAGTSGQRASHRYSLADFGLTDEQVDERFAGLS